MACPPAGPWAAPLWATGPGSLCWSLCPPGEGATALRPKTRALATHPETHGEDSPAIPHSRHLAFVPQTQLGASSSLAMPSQDGAQGPQCQPLFLQDICRLRLVGAYLVPRQAHMSSRSTSSTGVLDFTTSRLMCQEHLTKPRPKPPPPQPRTADISLEFQKQPANLVS